LPLHWEDVGGAARTGRANHLVVLLPEGRARLAQHGDPFAPIQSVKQRLPI
ncbi:MAG: hypothetical protein JWL70_2382, partial [Acidimicrobiia bacterium]|nr:hypothetical protein [Acidimicrobiia bacterium]